ncbi:radical SAM protein [bacterium]|nr:radical SAM protein [bacterium]
MSKRHNGAHKRAEWSLVCANERGEFWDEPKLAGAARSGLYLRLPRREELSPLPEAAVLQFLPQRAPLGWPAGSSDDEEPLVYEGALAVAAQLPSGWTRTLLPAWENLEGAEALPIFGYTAVFYHEDRLWCAAVQTEDNDRWHPCDYALPELEECIKELKKLFPHNRLIDHLAHCATCYGCYNAQNIFYGRWEGAAPISPVCNATCRGCISKQPEGAPPSPQIRLQFKPTAEEVAELGVFHLSRAERGIYTFGQGCEGEPSLQADVASEAIRLIRQKTEKGTLHMNSNGSKPNECVKMFEAGLNSLRVSLCSAREETYNAYYRPRGYAFKDVLQTIKLARQYGLWVSLNLLLLPGLNDTTKELDALLELVNRYDVNMIQMRNLNIDPDWLSEEMELPEEMGIGVAEMIKRLRREAPKVRIGSHNPSREEMVK